MGLVTPQFEHVKITTATSTTVSSTLELAGRTLEAILVPDIDGTALRFSAAAPLTQGDPNQPGTFRSLVATAGTAYEVTIADNTYIVLDHDVFVGVRWLRLVFQTVQTADRDVICVLNSAR